MHFLAIVALIAVFLLVTFVLAIPSRARSVVNWLRALFSRDTAWAAIKDAAGLVLPWTGRLSRGAFWLLLLGYLVASATLIYQLGQQIDLAPFGRKFSESFESAGDAWVFVPWALAKVITFGDTSTRVILCALIVWLYLPVVISAKRLRDMNRSGLWLLFILAPYVGGLALIVLLGVMFCVRGTDGLNAYGRAPQDDYERAAPPRTKKPRQGSENTRNSDEGSSDFMENLKRGIRSKAFTEAALPKRPDYLSLVLPLLAKVAASSGKLSVRAENIISIGLIRANCPDKNQALRMQSLLREAAVSKISFSVYLSAFMAAFWLDKQKLIDTQNFLFDVATVDGEINPAAEEMLMQAAKTFKRQCPRLAKYRKDREPPPPKRTVVTEEQHAATLGLTLPTTLEAAEMAYKSRSKEYHPNFFAQRGAKIQALAEEEMKKINAAMEFFRKKFGHLR
jgi:uncharacterized membrane protein YhaH (DUF805 family)